MHTGTNWERFDSREEAESVANCKKRPGIVVVPACGNGPVGKQCHV